MAVWASVRPAQWEPVRYDHLYRNPSFMFHKWLNLYFSVCVTPGTVAAFQRWFDNSPVTQALAASQDSPWIVRLAYPVAKRGRIRAFVLFLRSLTCSSGMKLGKCACNRQLRGGSLSLWAWTWLRLSRRAPANFRLCLNRPKVK